LFIAVTAIRKQGKVNANTTLIDAGMYGVAGTNAVYLVESGQSCLIDTGGAAESARVARTLTDLGAFPPDRIVLTHAHWDHSQAVPDLRRRAGRLSKTIPVLAGSDSIPLLEDQSWNAVLDKKLRFENIHDIQPLVDGDVIDLDGLALEVIEAPGHIKGHIALYDQSNRNLFLGDSIGYKYGDDAVIPNFIPPFWDREAYRETLVRLRAIDYDHVSLAHFGYLSGDEARGFLDEAEVTNDRWWGIFDRVDQEGRLDDLKYLASVIIEETDIVVPDLIIERLGLRMLLGLVNITRMLSRKPPMTSGEALLPLVLGMLVEGYRTSKGKG
jgi:glyoxylase-like metal-dependent hydrolase (beta-lactamase superfamily II)